jgi:antitoxin component of MazEF toxin-antitoxin module
VFTLAASVVVTIPVEIVRKLEIKPGDEIVVELDESTNIILMQLVRTEK